jgi:hypothetical protein
MPRVYTNLKEWVILDAYEEVRYPAGGQYEAQITIKKNKKTGEIYECEKTTMRKQNAYKNNALDNRSYEVVIQYIDNLLDLLVDVRLYTNKYEKWILNIKKQTWSHREITNDELKIEQEDMQNEPERQKQIELEEYTKRENMRLQREQQQQQYEEMKNKYPSIGSYIEQLQEEIQELKGKILTLNNTVTLGDERYEFQIKHTKSLEEEIKKLKQQITTLQKAWPTWLKRMPTTKNNFLDLMTQLQRINESDDTHP